MNGKQVALTLSLLLATTSAPIGCSSHSRETRTVETSDDPSARGSYRHEETTTTESSKESSDCGGVLSCTVDTLGSIIALPFKAVGALIGAIF